MVVGKLFSLSQVSMLKLFVVVFSLVFVRLVLSVLKFLLRFVRLVLKLKFRFVLVVLGVEIFVFLLLFIKELFSMRNINFKVRRLKNSLIDMVNRKNFGVKNFCNIYVLFL